MSAKKSNLGLVLKLGAVVVVLVVAGLMVSSRLRAPARVAAAYRNKAVDIVIGSVTVHAAGDIKEIKSEAEGKVLKCEAVDPNHFFKTGDVLVQLDDAELKRQKSNAERDFKSAQDRLKIAEKNPDKTIAQEKLDEAKRMFDQGRGKKDDVTAAERYLEAVEQKEQLAKLDNDRAVTAYNDTLLSLETQIERMAIRAAFDGQIQDSTMWQGEIIGQNTIVAHAIANTRTIVAKIAEDDFGKIKEGQTGTMTLVIYGNRKFPAKVSKILATADPDTQRYTIFLEVEAKDIALPPFSNGEVAITVGERENALLIKRRAIINGDQIFVVKNGVVERRKIATGFVGLNVAEVTSGLQPGELVIVDDLDEFHAGQSVRPEVVP